MLPVAGKDDQRPPRPEWKRGKGLTLRQRERVPAGKGGFVFIAASHLGLNHISAPPGRCLFNPGSVFRSPWRFTDEASQG